MSGARKTMVRRLGPDDVGVMAELMTVFGRAFEDADSYQKARPGEAYVRDLLGRDHFIVLVAEEGGAVIGGLAAYRLDKFEQERSEIYIYDLAVAEEHRRRRVATTLIRGLQDVAALQGAYVIFVQADHGDDPAIALYAKLGVREDVLHFDITVPPTRSA